MEMFRLKGMSPVIAITILLMMTVAVAGIFYIWAQSQGFGDKPYPKQPESECVEWEDYNTLSLSSIHEGNSFCKYKGHKVNESNLKNLCPTFDLDNFKAQNNYSDFRYITFIDSICDNPPKENCVPLVITNRGNCIKEKFNCRNETEEVCVGEEEIKEYPIDFNELEDICHEDACGHLWNRIGEDDITLETYDNCVNECIDRATTITKKCNEYKNVTKEVCEYREVS